MAYEIRPNTGSLHKNERKTTENHPNATGSALIDGVAYWVDSWTKEGKNGKWQSLSFKRKDERHEANRKAAVKSLDTDLDDAPF